MGFAVQTVKEIFELVRDDLALVEREIAGQNAAAIEPVCEISSYLREGGGKRLRPALLLLAAGASGYRGPSAIRLGAVVELIHNATLIHDDVIDGANTRRGRPSANARWGNHMSVLAGDWLYMQSFEMALRERNFAILDILIDLTQNMVEGELLQLTRLGRQRACLADARGSVRFSVGSRKAWRTRLANTGGTRGWRSSWWMICWTSQRRLSS
jgi:octaprenyl-diphosphate synthase